MRHTNAHKALSALFFSLLLVGCGQLDLLPGGGGDGSGGGGANGSILCSPADTGPDTDGDGLSDACERERGTDPYKADTDGNGITDPNELPPGMTLEEAQQSSWFQGFIQQLMAKHQTGNLLTGSFFQKKAPAGTEVTLTAQTLEFFIDGKGNGNTDHYNFCHDNGKGITGNNYIYFYIAGSVKICDSCAVETSYMKLCGTLDNPSSTAEYTQEFAWHIAQTSHGKFDPKIIPRGGGTQSITITPKSHYSGTNTVKKVKVKFDSKFHITGSATNPVTGEDTQVKTEDISVFRVFLREGQYDGDNDQLNGQYTRDPLDSVL